MKVMALECCGFRVLPETAVDSAPKRYGLHVFGTAEVCRVLFQACTAARLSGHPAETESLRSKSWLTVLP